MMNKNYWHIQMYKPEGPKGIKIPSISMLQEDKPVIGTAEWDDIQCKQFKDDLKQEDIILVREGAKVLALCKVISNNFQSEELTAKYMNKNFRYVKVLQVYNDIPPFPQPQGTLQRLVNKNTDSYIFVDNLYQNYQKV